MKSSTLLLTVLAVRVSTLAIRDDGCSFGLTAAGGVSGPLSQLDNGQNRVDASGLPIATYTIGPDGGIYDQAGRGCILAPPTTQFQCDAGASPTTGFSVGCDGTLSYDDGSDDDDSHDENTRFVACQTGANGWNVYLTGGSGQTGCVDITLNADSCYSGCAPSPPPPNPSTSPAPPPPASTACPADLSGAYEFPHLIVPVSSEHPDTAYGTSYNGKVSSSDIESIFNFDIPPSAAGKSCSLVFLFPNQDELLTSSFTIDGDGEVGFASLSGVADLSTTYNNAPGIATDYGIFHLAPGNSYTIATFDCPAGTAQSYEMTASGTDFDYFQNYNPAPIGLYITVC